MYSYGSDKKHTQNFGGETAHNILAGKLGKPPLRMGSALDLSESAENMWYSLWMRVYMWECVCKTSQSYKYCQPH